MDLDASVGLHLDSGDLGAAISELEATLAVDSNPDARLALGLGYYFVGRFDEGEAHLRHAYLAFKDAGRTRKTALAATHLGRIEHSGFGNAVVAAGWFTRARRWLENDEACAERGWLALGIVGCAVTDADELHRNAELALHLGRELGDVDLECRALADYGLALVDRGSYAEGMERIDEAMTMIRSGECSNLLIAGQVECCFVSACERAGDLARLEGWFSAATRERPHAYGQHARPNMIATHCRTDFGSLLCLAGRWSEADEALRAAVQSSERMHREHYRASRAALADLRIGQGRLHEAAELLRGLETEIAASVPTIRLHLARGEHDLAATKCREALRAFTGDLLRGSRFLDLLVLAELGRGRADDAADAANQLTAAAEISGRAPVRARASLAFARVALARGDRDVARAELDTATAALQSEPWALLGAELNLELAQLLADTDPGAAVVAAQRALAVLSPIGAERRYAAQQLLTRLGAEPEASIAHPLDALTPREREILALIAQGLSNPQIAATLVIAPKTAEHHVGAILRKLGLRRRSEAAVYAATLN
jgi:DNA-binding CsgD family transcriptional regulator/tetratricopeptide (TPR) repeat protein